MSACGAEGATLCSFSCVKIIFKLLLISVVSACYIWFSMFDPLEVINCMKICKLDKQQKLFDLYKVLGTVYRIESVNGDIVLDDELKAVVFAAIEPVLKKRIAKGILLPVFEGDFAMQIDAFPDAGDPVEDNAPDGCTVGVGETPLDPVSDVSIDPAVKAGKRKKYVDGFEKP